MTLRATTYLCFSGAPGPRQGARGRSEGNKDRHYRRIPERPFTEDQRPHTTVLIGNLTQKHEALLRAVFRRHGLLVESLPDPTKAAFRIGKEYSNNGLCNPVYYTAGALILYLKELRAQGLTREEIEDRYVYLTLSDCGPCRFGLYESEYRQALENAGFPGFRVLTTQLNRASRTGGERPGLDFSIDQWLGLVNALILGDLLYSVTYRLRPYEAHPGETDRVVGECVSTLETFLYERGGFELRERVPGIVGRALDWFPRITRWIDLLLKYRHHYYSADYREVLALCKRRLGALELDRTRPKPVVKVVGEFYSHISETDANYKMFSFLEAEGAEVAVGSIGGVLQYWLFKSRRDLMQRRGLGEPHPEARWWQIRRRYRNWKAFAVKPFLLWLIARVSRHQYRRLNRALGGLSHIPTPQEVLARAAESYYRPLTRGGEGHLEVAESIHSTANHHCHMVLSLKPFGCMPSTQSDGVMATVATHFDEMLFSSIETTGDSDINAYSRVQMVLSDAKRRANREFDRAIQAGGLSLEEVRAFIAAKPHVRRAGHPIPRSPGVVGEAANRGLHLADLMDGRRPPEGRG